MHSIDALSEDERVERYEKLARKALTAYALEDADLRFLGPGTNVVFRVQTDDGRWALRICHPDHDHDALMRELLWLVAINRDTKLPAPEPVIMRSGELLRSVSMPGISGFHPCMLFRWVKGQPASDLGADHLRAVGRMTAALHQHAGSFRWPEELSVERSPLPSLGEALSALRVRERIRGHDFDALQAVIPAVLEIVLTLGDGPDVAGVIHGDLRQGNLIYHAGEARALDFERTHWNHYAYDLAATLAELSSRKDFAQLKNAYLDGYAAVRPLPCDPDEHLPVFEAMHALTRIASLLRTERLQHGEGSGIVHAAATKVRRLLERE